MKGSRRGEGGVLEWGPSRWRELEAQGVGPLRSCRGNAGAGRGGRAVNLSIGELGMSGFADAMKSELLSDTFQLTRSSIA